MAARSNRESGSGGRHPGPTDPFGSTRRLLTLDDGSGSGRSDLLRGRPGPYAETVFIRGCSSCAVSLPDRSAGVSIRATGARGSPRSGRPGRVGTRGGAGRLAALDVGAGPGAGRGGSLTDSTGRAWSVRHGPTSSFTAVSHTRARRCDATRPRRSGRHAGPGSSGHRASGSRVEDIERPGPVGGWSGCSAGSGVAAASGLDWGASGHVVAVVGAVVVVVVEPGLQGSAEQGEVVDAAAVEMWSVELAQDGAVEAFTDRVVVRGAWRDPVVDQIQGGPGGSEVLPVNSGPLSVRTPSRVMPWWRRASSGETETRRRSRRSCRRR